VADHFPHIIAHVTAQKSVYLHAMKFYDKYPKLKEKDFLVNLLTDTVFSTMALEDQTVPKPRVREIVLSFLDEQESKGTQFFNNQGI
jgi:hypothetical protein